MNIAILAVTDSSEKTALRLKDLYPGTARVYRPGRGELQTLVKEIFHQYEGLVFIMATGIVIRMIAPLITDKFHDPAVVTVDDACRYAVSTLSGHEGGANGLTWTVASLLNCEPVITTASDTNRKYVLGVGCRKGIDSQTVKEEILNVLNERGLVPEDLRCAATAEVKRGEEGLHRALGELGIPLLYIPLEEIRRRTFIGVEESEAARRHFDIPGVCEPCALITARRGTLIIKKRKNNGVTLALAEESLCPDN